MAIPKGGLGFKEKKKHRQENRDTPARKIKKQQAEKIG